MTVSDDFKPASVDPSRESCVEVGEGNQVTVTVPHVEVSLVGAVCFPLFWKEGRKCFI